MWIILWERAHSSTGSVNTKLVKFLIAEKRAREKGEKKRPRDETYSNTFGKSHNGIVVLLEQILKKKKLKK
jgi:hypothetical protein